MKKLTIIFVLLLACSSIFASILTDYVYKPDGYYNYGLTSLNSDEGATTLVVNMTSQFWQDTPITNTVVIIVPKSSKITDTAVLLNTGGSYDGSPLWAQLGTQMAKIVSCPVCIVFDIPNQPMWGKKEDALLSYTLKQALDANDLTEKPLLLQMAKSVVKSMDTIEALSQDKLGIHIKKFIITGASKRGWTSWISAGTKDKRIVAIMPIVFDWLNMKEQIPHQRDYYKELSVEIGDYTQLNFDKLVEKPEGKNILELIDPFYYNVDIPKMIINASNDPYWTLDSASLYFPKLKGEKFLFYKPNASHDMGLAKFADDPIKGFFEILPMLNNMKIFVDHICLNKEMHNIDYKWSENKEEVKCELKLKSEPFEVIYYTKEVEKRDFREVNWEGKKLEPTKGKYIFKAPKPKNGYVGSYIEVKFKDENNTPYSVFTVPYVSK